MDIVGTAIVVLSQSTHGLLVAMHEAGFKMLLEANLGGKILTHPQRLSGLYRNEEERVSKLCSLLDPGMTSR